MDINGMNKLANMEQKQRIQSLPRVSEFGDVNVSTEPGWLLQMFHRLEAALNPIQAAPQPAPTEAKRTSQEHPSLTCNPAKQ